MTKSFSKTGIRVALADGLGTDSSCSDDYFDVTYTIKCNNGSISEKSRSFELQ